MSDSEKKNDSITKSDLIEEIAVTFSNQLKKKEVELAVNTIFDAMKEALVENKRVEIRGLGSFRVKERHSRVGRNPKSGNDVSIPNRKTPFFKVGRDLKERINLDD
jgi:integration host factor subunit beta